MTQVRHRGPAITQKVKIIARGVGGALRGAVQGALRADPLARVVGVVQPAPSDRT